MQVSEIDIGRIVPYARNPRRNDDAVAKVAASIAEFGWRQPIVVDEQMVIVAGHTRYEAARKLGLPTVPIHVASGLSSSQIKAYRLMDNRSHQEAEWDFDLLALELKDLQLEDFDLDLTGFDEAELGRLLASEDDGAFGGGDEYDIPEPPADPITRPGDLWLLGKHRLLCGDSTDGDHVKRLMNGERAILFATDPPYLVDYDGTNHPGSKNKPAAASKNKDWSKTYGVTWDDSSQGPELYQRFIKAAIAEAIDPHAAWYCWHASRRQAMVEAVWIEMGAFVHQQIIWSKDRPILTRSHYLWQHEPCLFGWIKGNKPLRVAEDYLGTIWAIPSLKGEERPDHPTPKPLDCFAIPMRQHAEPDGLCYEPFSGSGSQIIAGEAVGRRVYAMEISPAYVDVAVMRWQIVTGKSATLESDGRSFDDTSAAIKATA